MFIVVEGNIGAGKSYLIRALHSKLRDLGCDVVMQLERINKWRNYNGVNMLKSFYDNKDYWAFRFQIVALLDSIKNEMKATTVDGVILAERSTLSVLEIFSPINCTDLEICILKDIATHLPASKPDIVIYIRTEPDICYQRLKKRGRQEEVGVITQTYIDNLHDLHEKIFNKSNQIWNGDNLLVVDGKDDINVILDKVLNKIIK